MEPGPVSTHNSAQLARLGLGPQSPGSSHAGQYTRTWQAGPPTQILSGAFITEDPAFPGHRTLDPML